MTSVGGRIERNGGKARHVDQLMPEYAERIIDEMVRRIVERFEPDRIILFGSRARGDACPSSYVDLPVVMRDATARRDTVVTINRLLAAGGLAKDIIVISTDALEAYRDVVGTVICEAAREDEVVYYDAAS